MTDNSVGDMVAPIMSTIAHPTPPPHQNKSAASHSTKLIDKTWRKVLCLLRPPLRQIQKVHPPPATTSNLPIPVDSKGPHRLDILESGTGQRSERGSRSTPTQSSSRAAGSSREAHSTSHFVVPTARHQDRAPDGSAVPTVQVEGRAIEQR